MKTYVVNQNHLLKEQIDRGDPLIPVYLYENNWQAYELYLHWHEEMEWIMMDKGSAVFNVEGITYTLNTGDCLFISPRQLHSGRSITPICQFRAILIHLDFLASKEDDFLQTHYIDPLMSGELCLPTFLKHSGENTTAAMYMNRLSFLLKTRPTAWPLHLKAELLGQIAHLDSEVGLQKTSTASTENPKSSSALRQLLYFMKQHCHEKLTLDQLAAKMNFNPQYFCRYFKTATGMTPFSYLTLLRIEKAALMLLQEDVKVSEICYECGFDNVSYFIRTFKRMKGVTPKQYTQNQSPI